MHPSKDGAVRGSSCCGISKTFDLCLLLSDNKVGRRGPGRKPTVLLFSGHEVLLILFKVLDLTEELHPIRRLMLESMYNYSKMQALTTWLNAKPI